MSNFSLKFLLKNVESSKRDFSRTQKPLLFTKFTMDAPPPEIASIPAPVFVKSTRAVE